ncbi:endonuclease domain-containing protein [Rhodococcus kronopolitis]|uniref:Endonuclease domain-containing protein n=1 Tax=Rhodococcus kronopolitis TaxID=1460226 RepID=A0ABV9FYU9_9NOCA
MIRSGHYRPAPNLLLLDFRLEPGESTFVEDIRVATPARAAFDLGRRLPRREAIVALDGLCHATGLKPEEVGMLADRHPGARGIAALRSLLVDVDGGAESPPETHTRLTLVDSGLPRPETQIVLFGTAGWEFARADLGWREWRVLVEYDGEHHWKERRQRAWDIERLARIEALGWTVVRVGAELLYDRPGVLVRRVRDALRTAGAPV